VQELHVALAVPDVQHRHRGYGPPGCDVTCPGTA
jgi:hypothetical protein